MEATFLENITNKIKQLELKKALYNRTTKENEVLQEQLQVLEKYAEAKQLHEYCNGDSNILFKQQLVINYMQNEINQLDYLQSSLSDILRKKQQLCNDLFTTRRQYAEEIQMLIGNKNAEVDQAVKLARNNLETIKIQFQTEYRAYSDEVDNTYRQLELMQGEKMREKDHVLLEIYKSQQDNANLFNYVVEENKRYIELSKQKCKAASKRIKKSKSPIKIKKSYKEILEETMEEKLGVKTDTEEKNPPIQQRKRLFSIEENRKALRDSCKKLF